MIVRAIRKAIRDAFAAPSASPICIRSATRCICVRRRGSDASLERSTEPLPPHKPHTHLDSTPRRNDRPRVVPRPAQIGHSIRTSASRIVAGMMTTIVCRPIVCKPATMAACRMRSRARSAVGSERYVCSSTSLRRSLPREQHCIGTMSAASNEASVTSAWSLSAGSQAPWACR